jgi:hypothetical protein
VVLRRTVATAAVAALVCAFTDGGGAVAADVQTLIRQPTANVPRITAAEAPQVDGDISDPVWAKAVAIEDFYQSSPNAGDPASERTVVRIMYDDNNIYFAVYAYDSEPDQITLRAKSRDGPLFGGDVFRITLDPGATRRNGYSFAVGPSGGRSDAIFQNNTDNLQEWDAIWAARAHVVSDGWVAEIAVPFRSLSYEPRRAEWGFEFSRSIRHRNENVRWSNIRPNTQPQDVSQAGTLTGIHDIATGIGLDIQPYAAIRVKRDWHIPGEDTGLSGTAGGNIFYKVTPALTGTLTFNPDFSDSPLDARQVNTTRFSLFTPETRDFFLQDVPTFEFGGHNFTFANKARPFFSRNIGLASGRPVSLVLGGKLSGEYAGFGIGALSVLTDRTQDRPGQVLSVARITHPVFRESKVGFIVTNGDPTGKTRNTVAGADFQYRDSNFLPGQILQADAFYERSFSSEVGEDDTFGLAFNYPNEPWGGELRGKEIGANFDPELGFANRTGIRVYDGEFYHVTRFRNNWKREWRAQTEHTIITDLNNEIESREHVLFTELETAVNDRFTLTVKDYFELIREPFDLPRDVIVPAGRYEWANFAGRVQSAAGRPLQVVVEAECCSFYDGDAYTVEVMVNYRPNESFELLPRYEGTFIDLPTGQVDIHVLTLNATYNFTPDMQLAIQTQYDNISEQMGFLARYRWEFTPASQLFIALGTAAAIPGTHFQVQRTTFLVRVGHTFRF